MNQSQLDPMFGGLPPELWAEYQRIQRNNAIANLLQTRSLEPLTAPQIKGRFEARVHPLEGLGKMAEAFVGQKLAADSEARGTDFSRRYQEGMAKAVGDYARGGQPRLENKMIDPGFAAPDESSPATNTTVQTLVPPSAADEKTRIATAMTSPYPVVRNLATTDYAELIKRQQPHTVGHSLIKGTGEVIATDPAFAEQKKEDRAARENNLILQLAQQANNAEAQRATLLQIREAGINSAQAIAAAGRANAMAIAEGRNATARDIAAARLEAGQVKLKPGERFTATGDVEAIPGSDVYVKQSNAHSKDYNTLGNTQLKVDSGIRKLDKILAPENVGAFNSNFGGYNAALITQHLPGKTQDIKAMIEAVKSDMKAAGLDAMRSGGAIGQMTEKEWPIVEKMLANITPMMGEKAAREELMAVRNYIMKIGINAKNIYDTEWSKTQFYKGKRETPETPTPAPKEMTSPPQVIRFDAQGNPIQ